MRQVSSKTKYATTRTGHYHEFAESVKRGVLHGPSQGPTLDLLLGTLAATKYFSEDNFQMSTAKHWNVCRLKYPEAAMTLRRSATELYLGTINSHLKDPGVQLLDRYNYSGSLVWGVLCFSKTPLTTDLKRPACPCFPRELKELPSKLEFRGNMS